jgi:hypothetical protein
MLDNLKELIYYIKQDFKETWETMSWSAIREDMKQVRIKKHPVEYAMPFFALLLVYSAKALIGLEEDIDAAEHFTRKAIAEYAAGNFKKSKMFLRQTDLYNERVAAAMPYGMNYVVAFFKRKEVIEKVVKKYAMKGLRSLKIGRITGEVKEFLLQRSLDVYFFLRYGKP